MLSEDFADRLNEEGKERLTTIVRLSRRMDDLLDSLLEYSRVDREDFDKVEVDMNEVAADALESLSARIESQKTEIRIPACLPVVRGDYHRLSEVLLNLISNAVKYNDKEEKWVEVGVESGGEKARPVFYVRDNGIGIRAEHTEQIFQIFRRLHGRDQHGGGAGAGLTIAKKIIERHGGRIWVESKPGFGSTFRFSLSA
jgi:light-regulated signal transduction histidine kinase (bacteriophytochrome)